MSYPGGAEDRVLGNNNASRHSVFKIRLDRGLPEGLWRLCESLFPLPCACLTIFSSSFSTHLFLLTVVWYKVNRKFWNWMDLGSCS